MPLPQPACHAPKWALAGVCGLAGEDHVPGELIQAEYEKILSLRNARMIGA